jgi:hypothetical protein
MKQLAAKTATETGDPFNVEEQVDATGMPMAQSIPIRGLLTQVKRKVLPLLRPVAVVPRPALSESLELQLIFNHW